jgi:uncharacterized protein YdaU (DUF1376 family)
MTAPSHDKWMPFYPGAYLRQTGRLTAAQHGAYVLLLLEAWAHDGLIPDDDEELAQITRMSPREWRSNKAKVLRFWVPVDGGYRQERLDQELARAKHLVAVKSEAGKASAEARKRQRKGNARSTPVATEPPTDGQQTSIPLQSPYSDTNVSGADAPIDADAKAWRDAVELLTSNGRTDQKPARSFFGKLLKANPGLEARDLLSAIGQAIANGTQDPQAYLTKAAAGVDRRRTGAPAPTTRPSEIDWAERVRIWRATNQWLLQWGAEPGDPQCQCPADLLEAV